MALVLPDGLAAGAPDLVHGFPELVVTPANQGMEVTDDPALDGQVHEEKPEHRDLEACLPAQAAPVVVELEHQESGAQVDAPLCLDKVAAVEPMADQVHLDGQGLDGAASSCWIHQWTA